MHKPDPAPLRELAGAVPHEPTARLLAERRTPVAVRQDHPRNLVPRCRREETLQPLFPRDRSLA